MISAETPIEELFGRGLMSVRAINACRKGGIATLGQLLMARLCDLGKIRNCGQTTRKELVALQDQYKNCMPVSSNTPTPDNGENSDNDTTQKEEANKKIELLSPNAQVQLKSWLTWKFKQLSERAKKAFPQFGQLSSVVETLYSSQQFNPGETKNVGKKTCHDIMAFLEEARIHIEELTEEIDVSNDMPAYSARERVVAEFGAHYPFLLTKECEAMVTHMLQYGFSPILYIARQYILRSTDPRMSIYREYYGFNADERRYNLAEIAIKHALSRERIRQLVNQGVRLPKDMGEEIRQYLMPIMGNVIPFDSSFWNKIQCENMLEETYSQTALLVCSLTDTHTAIQIEDTDKEYLVNKNLIENVKVRHVLTSIVKVIALRRTTVERLDILAYIKADKRTYHKDVEQLCEIYADYLRRNFDIVIEGNRYVRLLPNALDISLAIEDILAQAGHPMSLDEIRRVFNRLHPSNAIDDPTKLKPYIFRNPNIKPKGKTGIYILKSWANHFTGTLTSYLEYILHTFNDPIPLDDLVDFALEEFPKSNKKSIYSLIIGDKENRFIIYEDDYIGSADNPMSQKEFKERRINRRYAFETRFEDLKQFVSTLKRFPIQTGSEEEKALARWIINVLKSNIECTEEQVWSLKDFLNEHKILPQNGTEYNFKRMCDEIKIMVTKSFSLPTATKNKCEYNWLRKNMEKYTTYEDNRKPYFEDLLAYLKDFGFYL